MSETIQTNFFRLAKSRIKLLWQGNRMTPAAVPHPIEFYKTLERGRKIRSFAKRGVRGKLDSLGTVVRTRMVNGPELNILFLGAPFLIDVGITAIKNNVRVAKNKRRDKRRVQGGGGRAGGGHVAPPMPQAPHSDRFSRLRDQFLEMGMSRDGAEMIVSGELEGKPIEEYLDESDLGIVAAWLAENTVGESEDDERALEKMLDEG